MAKTIDKESNSAARTTDAVREPQDVEETDAVNEAQDDDFDVDDAPLADEADDVDEIDDVDEADAADERLAVAPVADAERAVARRSAAGVEVPAALLKNPFTRQLAEAYIELRKVTWPTRRDAWNMTLVVIVVSAIMAGLLAATDWGLGHLLSYFVSIGK